MDFSILNGSWTQCKKLWSGDTLAAHLLKVTSASLLTVASIMWKTRKQSKRPPIGKWVNKI